jgi:hypothetical protein
MSRIGHRVRSVANRLSMAITRLWCHSGIRRMLTGYGPTAMQWRLSRREIASGRVPMPSAEQMQARAAAIDRLLDQHSHEA